ncbi:MAG: succinate dehydrogenase assembly factor 2 [gamma proteobacterium symbiont of Taylorina sp.]|nr:succinate dehydrogenase assembly factor 2 [gamma proteobacterium symbiont of Taylorina sp.]
MINQQPDCDLKALRMLCRRGIRELDILLQCYMNRYYQSASIEEIREFKLILQMDDHSLLSLILNPAKDKSMTSFLLCQKLQYCHSPDKLDIS